MVTTQTSRSSSTHRRRQVVFSFDEYSPSSLSASVRGGKGYHLMEMAALGLPVPCGFTVSTTVARAYRETGMLQMRFFGQFERAVQRLERQADKRFNDLTKPLIVSVRSGAAASMPGMLDTVLNVGMNHFVAKALAAVHGEAFAYSTYRRFMEGYAVTVCGFDASMIEVSDTSSDKQACQELEQRFMTGPTTFIPADPRDQLMESMYAIWRSWSSERAVAYRESQNLPDWWGTAVTVQEMVFGNYNDRSGTGVVFSHDVATGRPGLYGEFLPNAQGEDVVAGVRTPEPISQLATWAPGAHEKLAQYVSLLREHFGDIVDVEFTIQDGELFILQARRAKRTPRAAVTYAVHEVWAGRMTREQVLDTISPETVALLLTSAFESGAIDRVAHRAIAHGLSASPGAVSGVVALSSASARRLALRSEPIVLVTRETSPDDLPGMLVSHAFVTQTGGVTCHAAVVARELGLPAIVGAADLDLDNLQEGEWLSIDGASGLVVRGELPVIKQQLSKEENIFLRWRDSVSTPWIDFDSYGRRYDGSVLLNDFYLSDAAVQAAAETSHLSRSHVLRNDIHKRTAGIFAAYLLVAVASELRYAQSPERARLLAYSDTRLLAQTYRITPLMDKHAVMLSTMQLALEHDTNWAREFFEFAERLFMHEAWGENPYIGGPKWAAIARAGRMYLAGELSHSLFVDHVFDLEHNGGKLFDKHSMLAGTHQFTVRQQLDVKRDVSDPFALFDSLGGFKGIGEPVRELFEALKLENSNQERR